MHLILLTLWEMHNKMEELSLYWPSSFSPISAMDANGHYYRIALLSRVDFRHLTRVRARDRYQATGKYLVVACRSCTRQDTTGPVACGLRPLPLLCLSRVCCPLPLSPQFCRGRPCPLRVHNQPRVLAHCQYILAVYPICRILACMII